MIGGVLYVVQAGLVVAAAVAGPRLARRGSRGRTLALAAGALVLFLLGLWLSGRPDVTDGRLPAGYVYLELVWPAIPGVFLFALLGGLARSRVIGGAVQALGLWPVFFAATEGSWVFRAPETLPPSRFIRGVWRQSTDYTCGPATLVSLLRAHGLAADESEMAALCGAAAGLGTTPLRMVQALRRKLEGTGWRAAVLRPDWEELERLRRPSITQVYWEGEVLHVVLLLRIETDARGLLLWLGDPLMGETPMRPERFRAEWNRTTIVMYRDSPYERE
ncbi:MAG: hypothetical protein HZA54_00030 [Planctomycetes bacterium]|nr:hypothetical protein [Planctomycetota bacterium]